MATTTDVLIIGGGPTGMAMALELAAHNVSFRIIDKALQRSDKSRALIVQPRTLELLNRHGPVRDFISKGNRSKGANLFVNGKHVVEIDMYANIPANYSPFPQPLMINQCETEHLLDDLLAKYGRSVERGQAVKSIEQDSDGVTVKLINTSGEEEIVRTQYVVGADGSHSVVRHSSDNFVFEGDAYKQEFALVDTHIQWSLPHEKVHIFLGKGFIAILPLNNGLVRVIMSRIGDQSSEEPKLADFQDFFDQSVPGGGHLHDPEWIARFNLHHRCANTYRDGRFFIAGDAAHIHSPAGGQGMNTGVQDSINLGWKLATVLQGLQPASLLETYNQERRPIGLHLLKFTDQFFSYASSTNRLFVLLRNLMLPYIVPRLITPDRILQGYKFMSEFTIGYRGSPIVGKSAVYTGVIEGGDRLPNGVVQSMNGTTSLIELITAGYFHLILFSGLGKKATSATDLKTIIRQQWTQVRLKTKHHFIFNKEGSDKLDLTDPNGEVHRSYGFDEAGYVFVRPDGYVAHIGLLSDLGAFVEGLCK